jgi:hypothetical protein
MTELKKGMNLNTSWGYSMTINDYCQIVEVSKTGKTVKCRMLSKEMNHAVYSGDGSGKAKAGSKVYGPEFRLRVGKCDWNTDGYSFVGSYPFCNAEELPMGTKMSECSSRKGYWSIDHGGESYENHWD